MFNQHVTLHSLSSYTPYARLSQLRFRRCQNKELVTSKATSGIAIYEWIFCFLAYEDSFLKQSRPLSAKANFVFKGITNDAFV